MIVEKQAEFVIITEKNGKAESKVVSMEINTVIELENAEKYVLLNETELDGSRYFLAMGVDGQQEIVSSDIAIFEELTEGEDTYADRVTDPELIAALTVILKP